MKHKPIEVIVAATPYGEIGHKNTIPWRLKGDLRRFKELTMGNIVLMGKNTYRSLPGPLEGRTVIVVSQSMFQSTAQIDENTHIAPNMHSALMLANVMGQGKKIFIAGGAALYEEALNWPNITVQLTTVYKDAERPYDTFIKNFDRLDKFHVVGEPETVFDGAALSHSYTTLVPAA